MPHPATPASRATVLLLAGEMREEWSRALTAGGLDVHTTGWLDALTAARVRRPDVVLVSTDLPAGAPQAICTTFRSTADLAAVPILVAGPGAERMDEEALAPVRADRYVRAPVNGDVLVREVRDPLSVAGLPRRRPAQTVVLALLALATAAAFVPALADFLLKGPPETRLGPIAFGVGVLAALAALVLGVATRERPLSGIERRRVLGWAATWIWCVGAVSPESFGAAGVAVFSVGCLAWAAWAWLGPRVKPTTPRRRRAFLLLAGTLVVLAAAPWIALLWIRAAG